MDQCYHTIFHHREPWNKGKLVGQKAPLRLKEIWAIRIRLQLSEKTRDLALFNLAIDSKLRSCDLVKLRVRDVTHGERITARAIVMQQKTRRPVQFEITETDARRSGGMDSPPKVPVRRLSVSKPAASLATSVHAAICAGGAKVGDGNWVRSCRLWHTCIAQNKGHPNIPPDQESSRRAVASRPYKAGEYGQVFGY
jgi:hypothetical protein